jgi:hypothetical protein
MTSDELIAKLEGMRDVEVQIRGGTETLLLGDIETVVDAAGGIVAIYGQERQTPEPRVVSVAWSEVVWIKGLPLPA